jgi:ABC-type transporter Mla subunit MlaD
MIVLAAVMVWFTFWVIGSRKTDHQVKASFASAFNLVPGLAIQVDGQEVGKIGHVKYENGKALVTIGINDNEFWPLHQGTKVISRWGTTIGNGTRKLDIIPGPATAPEIPQGGIIPTADTQPAVDVDLVLNSLTKKVRGSLSSWQTGMGASFKGKEKDLGALLDQSDDGTNAAADLLSDLGTDSFALKGLITNGQRTTSTLAGRDNAVRNLVTVAARTFETFANNTQGTQASIDELSPTLRQARSTLQRTDQSIGNLDQLVTELRPGAKALRPLAAAARPAFADLRSIVPSTLSTLRTGRVSAPSLQALLAQGTPFVTRAAPVLTDLAPMIGCVRPYAPETGGALLGLDQSHGTYDLEPSRRSGVVDPTDPMAYTGPEVSVNGKKYIVSHGLRAEVQASSSSLEKPGESKLFTTGSGLGVKMYAFPRPPGLNAGQPMMMPECGITKDALDASKDPEAESNMAAYAKSKGGR